MDAARARHLHVGPEQQPDAELLRHRDASQPGTLAVLPPTDSNVSGGTFANCLFTQPAATRRGRPGARSARRPAAARSPTSRTRKLRPTTANGSPGDPDPGDL